MPVSLRECCADWSGGLWGAMWWCGVMWWAVRWCGVMWGGVLWCDGGAGRGGVFALLVCIGVVRVVVVHCGALACVGV